MEAQLNHEVQLIENIRDKLKVKTFCEDDILKHLASNGIEPTRDIGMSSLVKYGVISPKFIWAPCVQLGGCMTPRNCLPPPRIWAHTVYKGAVGQPRKTTSLCNPWKSYWAGKAMIDVRWKMNLENLYHTKKAIDVCYQRRKTKMNLDVGFRRLLYYYIIWWTIFFPKKRSLIYARALMGHT